MPTYGKIRLTRQPVNSTIQAIPSHIDLAVDPDFPHVFFAVEFFSDSSGTPTTATGGTIIYTAETNELPGVLQTVTGGTVTATANQSVSASGNISSIRATFGGITGATHCRLNINANLS